MSAKKLFHLFFSFGLAMLILVSGTHALASTGYVTKGDVEATLQSWVRASEPFSSNLAPSLPRDFTQEERAQYGITDDTPTCPRD